MLPAQPGILAPVPAYGRYLFFSVADPRHLGDALLRLQGHVDGDSVVVGIGLTAVQGLGRDAVPGLRIMPPAHSTAGVAVPSTPMALWCWLRSKEGEDQGDLALRSQALLKQLPASAFRLENVVDGFRHGTGLDLTGYEDGTENPEGDAAISAALVQQGCPEMDGSSFVAVQQWQHDFTRWARFSASEQDAMIGRRRCDNAELADAPPLAHVKRTAQEDFNPPAFILRRSVPWVSGTSAGLMFVAFGKSFDAFEALLRRMTGQEDHLPDALFEFTRPLNGSYFWCPPMLDGHPDFRQIGIW